QAVIAAARNARTGLFTDPTTWAKALRRGIIRGVDNVEDTLCNVWKMADDVARQTMRDAGYIVDVGKKNCFATSMVQFVPALPEARGANTDALLAWLREDVRPKLEAMPAGSPGQRYLAVYNDSNATIQYLLDHAPTVREAVRCKAGLTLIT